MKVLIACEESQRVCYGGAMGRESKWKRKYLM